MAPSPSRTFPLQNIAARRRNEHARARALPRFASHVERSWLDTAHLQPTHLYITRKRYSSTEGGDSFSWWMRAFYRNFSPPLNFEMIFGRFLPAVNLVSPARDHCVILACVIEIM